MLLILSFKEISMSRTRHVDKNRTVFSSIALFFNLKSTCFAGGVNVEFNRGVSFEKINCTQWPSFYLILLLFISNWIVKKSMQFMLNSAKWDRLTVLFSDPGESFCSP